MRPDPVAARGGMVLYCRTMNPPHAPRGGARARPARPVRIRGRGPSRSAAATVAAAAVVLLLAQLGGLVELVRNPTTGPDYFAAAAFVAVRHRAGEPVIVAIPPPAYLALGSAADLVFLPSPLEAERAQRYTRRLPSGVYVDYWLGVPSIVTAAALCRALAGSPRPWLLVDEMRLGDAGIYAGPMADLIRARTVVVFVGQGGVTVRRPTDAGAAAGATCGAAAP